MRMLGGLHVVLCPLSSIRIFQQPNIFEFYFSTESQPQNRPRSTLRKSSFRADARIRSLPSCRLSLAVHSQYVAERKRRVDLFTTDRPTVAWRRGVVGLDQRG